MRYCAYLLVLSGCCISAETMEEMPFMQDEPAYTSPLNPGLRFEAKPRESLLARSTFGFPEPAKGIVGSQCDDITDGGPLSGPGCATSELKCNETIIGHTVGGNKNFDTTFYEKKFCTPATTNHDGGQERVYRLELPEGDWSAAITLDTPCANLDLFAIRWDDAECPNPDHLVPNCEATVGDWKRKSVRVASNHKSTWWVVVEGVGNEEGAFSLTTQCAPTVR